MAIFGFIALCAIAIILTAAILFAISCGGEEFSSVGHVPFTLGLLLIVAMWYGVFLLAPFKIVAQS